MLDTFSDYECVTEIDPMQEFTDAQAAFYNNPEAIRRSLSYGIPQFNSRAMLGLVKARIIDDLLYRPDERGAVLAAVPSGNHDHAVCWGWDDIFDIITFDPRRPERWWQRTGTEDVLGKPYLDYQRQRGRRVRFVATPLDYLRAGGHAACLLNTSLLRCDAVLDLNIICADRTLAYQLELVALRTANGLMPRVTVEDKNVVHV